jgi:hypothetical protein
MARYRRKRRAASANRHDPGEAYPFFGDDFLDECALKVNFGQEDLCKGPLAAPLWRSSYPRNLARGD